MELPPEFRHALAQTDVAIQRLNAVADRMEQCLLEADEPPGDLISLQKGLVELGGQLHGASFPFFLPGGRGLTLQGGLA